MVSQVFQDLRTITGPLCFVRQSRYRLSAILHGYLSLYVRLTAGSLFRFFKMRPKLFSLISVLLILSACQPQKEVAQVWGFIQEKPDSALTVLNAMNTSKLHGRTLAEYRLLKAMAMDKNYENVASDSLALPALKYFRMFGPREKEMMSLYYLAISRFYANEDADAVLLLEETVDVATQLGNHYFAGLGYMLKSHAFSRTYCISEAIRSAELGVKAFRAVPDSFQVQRAKLQLADTYHMAREFEKASSINRELVHTCQRDSFVMRQALTHGAYSMYMAHPELADSALVYYYRALQDYGATMDPVEAAHFADVACETGNTQIALQIAEQLKASGLQPEQVAYLEYKINLKNNQPWEALAAVKEFHTLQDSVIIRSLEQSLIKSQRDYQQQQKELSKQTLLLTRVIGGFILLCLLATLLCIFLYYAKKHRIATEEHAQLVRSAEDVVRLLQESEQKNLELVQTLQGVQLRYVSAYKQQFSQLSNVISTYYASSNQKNARDTVYRQVMEIAANIGGDQTRMGALERDVNNALDNAMKWYRAEYPGNTPEHYNMVCLFMAGFSTPMIELLTRIPKNTLYSKKSRLLEEIRNGSALHKELFLLTIK